MSKTLDFHKVKKEYLTVTLNDADISETGRDTVIMISTPTKAIMDDLLDLQDSIADIEDADKVGRDQLDDLYEMCSKIISRNKSGIKITADYLAQIFDIEDIFIFFNAYMEYVSEVSGRKN